MQSLFQSSIWTELVACNITDALREAGKVLLGLQGHVVSGSRAVDDIYSTPIPLPLSLPLLSSEECNSLILACAACASLCRLGMIRCGGEVLLADGTAAILVDINEKDHTAQGRE